MSLPNSRQLKFWRAEDRMRAAEVPAEDRDGAGAEPVTVSGWYPVPTKSGRPAWARYEWVNTPIHHAAELHCTYDRTYYDLANALVAEGADPLEVSRVQSRGLDLCA